MTRLIHTHDNPAIQKDIHISSSVLFKLSATQLLGLAWIARGSQELSDIWFSQLILEFSQIAFHSIHINFGEQVFHFLLSTASRVMSSPRSHEHLVHLFSPVPNDYIYSRMKHVCNFYAENFFWSCCRCYFHPCYFQGRGWIIVRQVCSTLLSTWWIFCTASTCQRYTSFKYWTPTAQNCMLSRLIEWLKLGLLW